MSLLSYIELCELVEQGVLEGVKPECINGTSIDLHLGPIILREGYARAGEEIVDLSVKPRQSVARIEVDLREHGYYDLSPFEGILAHTVEKFHLPDDINAEYYLNSSLARNHLEHLHAGHCDPGWNDATLTLELINLNRYHILRIRPGMRIGQVTFERVTPVPKDRSYSTIGNYNGQQVAQKVKG